MKAALVVAAHASPAAPQAGARRLRWPGSIEFTGSEEDPQNDHFQKVGRMDDYQRDLMAEIRNPGDRDIQTLSHIPRVSRYVEGLVAWRT